MMELSYSSEGFGDKGFFELIGLASESGIRCIELYAPQERTDFIEGALRSRNISNSFSVLRDRGIKLVCMDSAIDISKSLDISKAKLVIDSAYDLRTDFVAVEATEESEKIDKNIRLLLELIRGKNTTLLIKTKGIYSDTDNLRRLLDRYAKDELAALWETAPPVFEKSITPEETIKQLGAYVKHVHVSDYDEDGKATIIGEGRLPMIKILGALSSIDYHGCVSLVHKEETGYIEPDILLAYYVSYMARFSSGKRMKKKLYPNHDGTGEYVWKKDELIDLTLSQVLDRMVTEFPDQYCFKYTTLDYTRTYKQFRDDVDRCAAALIALGVRPGSKVAVWATNIPAWYITFWAVTKIGAVLVTVNTAYKIHEAEYLLRQSDTHTLVMIDSLKDCDYKGTIMELCPELEHSIPGEPLHCERLPFLRNVITVGFRMPGCLTWEEAMNKSEEVPRSEVLRLASQVRTGDVCNMQYTSGTTGFPKGVMLTHYNVVNNGKCIGDRMGLSTADRMMIQVPMFHCFGMVLSMISSMTHGTAMFPLPYFSPKSSLACIDMEKITCFNGVPTMFIAMFNHPDYRKTDFSYMRTGIMAGAGCPPELMKRAARPDEMNMRGIVSVYGQTESAPGSTMSAWTDSIEVRTETVGYAFPHILCKVVDPETGKELQAGVSGEFCSKGYNTMKGYYKMPGATAETVDREGWLHSGDLACADENGNYRITGRIKDMIIRGGENLYPKEIEEFIYTHPNVKDVQVIGVPDEAMGEEAMACVILKDGMDVTEEELRDYAKARLARHKIPKYIRFVDAFPMNAAGKVLKYKMREEAVEWIKSNN
ncbi:MAG: AMP-binding protein [Lachnospiraceae bacterium]|nr:AMP-binding protein [Lachnospiraceae bacterium]